MKEQLNLCGNENKKGLERKIYVSDLDCGQIVEVHLLKEDEPTPEENERLQRDVEKIMLQRELMVRYPEQFQGRGSRYSLEEAGQLLIAARGIGENDSSSQIRWLRKAGYTKVNVKDSSRRVPLEDAASRYVRAMYRTELNEVRRVVNSDRMNN